MSDWTKIREWVGRRSTRVPELSLTDASAWLAAATELLGDLKTLIDDLNQRIVALRPPSRVGTWVEGVGSVKVTKPPRKQTWDDDELLDAVFARARDERRVDPETGDPEDVWVTCRRVMSAVWPLDGKSARIGKAPVRDEDTGRILKSGTGLRGLGIDPDEFRIFTDGHGVPKVEVRA